MGIDSSHKLVGCLSGTRTCAMSERDVRVAYFFHGRVECEAVWSELE
jgi:hypothetical protein